MRIFRHWQGFSDDLRGAAIAIGNFDGIHLGHQAVIGEGRRLASDGSRPSVALTFEPHPRRFFRPDTPAFRLTPFRMKARLIEALGVDALVVLSFDRALASTEPEAFVADILIGGLGVREIVVGDNFAFGRARRGDTALLGPLAREAGIGLTIVPPVSGPDGEICSSSRVRELLVDGVPGRAAALLGRYWEIEGRVQEGDRRGRDLGFPTANIPLDGVLEPARGVYAVRAGLDRGTHTLWHDGVANLGVRPTVDGKSLLLEVHLFDFSEDLYGAHLRVALVEFLRPERKFDGLEALRAQIAADGEAARGTLAIPPWETGWPGAPPTA